MTSVALSIGSSERISGYEVCSENDLNQLDIRCSECFRRLYRGFFAFKRDRIYIDMDCLESKIKQSALELRSNIWRLLPSKSLLSEELQESMDRARTTVNVAIANVVKAIIVFDKSSPGVDSKILQTVDSLSEIENESIHRIKESLQEKEDPSEKEEEEKLQTQRRFLEVEDQLFIIDRIRKEDGEVEQAISRLLGEMKGINTGSLEDISWMDLSISSTLSKILNSQVSFREKLEQIKEKMPKILNQIKANASCVGRKSEIVIRRVVDHLEKIESLLGLLEKENLLQEKSHLLEVSPSLIEYATLEENT